MAVNPDGKVIISTRLDNSQIPNGIKEVKSSLGGLKSVVGSLGAAIAGAFSVMAIVKFATESVKAANQLSDALTGLKSILDGQGRSFSDAQKFLEEYTADGLMSMADAITAYKNLASRGYDDSQIKQIMVSLKDAAAFGRQAGYSMGEAVKGATEGLKNENSVLVDNAGVTKNVAKMWEEYAASIGTTANNLTMEQKRQAEYNGITEETRFQIGDAAKVAGTLSGQLSLLSTNFNKLKEAVGNALKPIVQSFLPVINVAIATLTRFANAIASVVSALFGNTASGAVEATQQVADGYNSAAEGAENLEKSTKEAGKAAKKYLAGFDELNKIGDSSGDGGSSGAVNTGGTTAQTTTTVDPNLEDNISPKIQALVDKIKELIEPLKNIDFGPAVKAFGRLKDAISPFTSELFEGLEWAWFNVLVPLSTWTIEEAGPTSIDTLSSSIGFLTESIGLLFTAVQDLWMALQPIVAFIAENVLMTLEKFKGTFDELAKVFEEKGPEIEKIFGAIGDAISFVWSILEPILSGMREAWSKTADFIIKVVADYVGYVIDCFRNVIDILAGIFTGDWDRVWAGVAGIFESTVGFIVNVAEDLLAAFGLTFGDIGKICSDIWTGMKNGASDAWNGIKSVFSSVASFFGDIFGKAWEKVKKVFSVGGKIFSGIKDGILNAFKAIVNAIIKGINTIVAIPFNGINAALTKIKDISIVGYQPFDWISTIPVPQIPYLAKGAVLPANKPFLAMVGDQKHGTNVEAPLATIQEAVAIVIEDMIQSNIAGHEATVGMLRQILEAVLSIDTSDERYAEAVDNYRRKMAVAKGAF